MDGWHLPRGFRAAAVKAGIKLSGALDLAVIAADRPCAAAGTFTTNRIAAAPVQWDRLLVPSEAIRAIVINAGNANAATGAQGMENTRRTATVAASLLGCAPGQVLIASTGIIGHQLPMDRLEAGLVRAVADLGPEEVRFREVSQAILTTDTRPKVHSTMTRIGGREVRVFGLAKGAAMIGPRMATMLGFLLTDARVAPGDLQAILFEAVEETFNCVSVEGHTSTNDTVLLLSGGDPNEPPLHGPDLEAFSALVLETCRVLAAMIPEDGEGATHRIKVIVRGALDRDEARTIARAVADSPLVKTAIHGADPNWGRIVSAAGYAGVPFEESELSLRLDGTWLYRDGAPVDFDAAAVSRSIRANRDVEIDLSLRRGAGRIEFWTSDLTAEYVRLNAEYTT